MQEQSYAKHSRYVPGFHFLTSGLILVFLVLSIINLVHCSGSCNDSIMAGMPVIASVIFLLLFWYARKFAVTVQDRAIRAEENFRHFVLTGKPFDSKLTMGQIIALRFASDDEFPGLAQRAAAEQLKGSEIKQAIKSWRADNARC